MFKMAEILEVDVDDKDEFMIDDDGECDSISKLKMISCMNLTNGTCGVENL